MIADFGQNDPAIDWVTRYELAEAYGELLRKLGDREVPPELQESLLALHQNAQLVWWHKNWQRRLKGKA